jgi:hypothetical protein
VTALEAHSTVDKMGFFTSNFTRTQTTTLLPLQPSSSKSSPPTPPPSSPPHPSLANAHKTALSLLHDPSEIITFNPLVTHFEEIDPNTIDINPLLPSRNSSSSELPNSANISGAARRYFRITESKPLLCGWYISEFDFHISYLAVDEGCDTVVSAPGGVSIMGTWRVEIASSDAGEAEGLRLFESATVTCPSIFARFIRGSLGSSHVVLHQRFTERWRARLSGEANDIPK